MATAQQFLDLIIRADTTNASSNLRNFQTVWTELNSLVNLAKTGFGLLKDAAEETYAFLREGAELEVTQQKFENLAATIGTTADALLTDLRGATQGLVSDAELMSLASDLISLGLVDNQEEAVRLSNVVTQLGLDMNQVVLTLANNSTLRLDALGLSFENVRLKAQELEEQGFDANEAFDLAVLESLEEKLNTIGPAATSALQPFLFLEAQAKNLGNTVKETGQNFDALEAPIRGAGAALFVANEVIKAANDGTIGYDEAVKALAFNIFTLRDDLEELNLTIEKIQMLEAAEDAASFDQAIIGLTGNISEAANTSGEFKEKMDEANDELRETPEAAEEAASGVDLLSSAMSGLGLATSEAVFWSTQLKVATGELTREEADLILKQAALQELVRDGVLTMPTYFSIISDGKITQEEWAAATGIAADELNRAGGEAGFLATQLGIIEGDHFINIYTNYETTGQPPYIPSQGGAASGGPGYGQSGGGGLFAPRQHGGPLSAGQLAIVGERGPELFVPSQSGGVMSNDDLRQLLSGMGGGSVNVQVFLDGNEIGGAVSTRLAQMGRRSAANAAAYTGI